MGIGTGLGIWPAKLRTGWECESAMPPLIAVGA